MDIVIYIITTLLAIYALLIIVRAVLSWLQPRPGGPVFHAQHLAEVLTEPYVRTIRRVLPVSRLGLSARYDFAGLVGLILLYIVILVLTSI